MNKKQIETTSPNVQTIPSNNIINMNSKIFTIDKTTCNRFYWHIYRFNIKLRK